MPGALIKVLVIDDEELIRWSLEQELSKEGYEVLTAVSGEEGLRIFMEELPEVVLLDQRLPGADGIQILKEIKMYNSSAIVIFMTAYSSIDTAVEAMKQGAFEYVNKPVEFEEIKLLISKALNAHKIEREVVELRRKLREEYGFSNIIGESEPMKEIFETIRKISHSEAKMVLIQGESGTGKDLVAKAIHYESRRSDKPFVTINCSALPETLLESELFGAEKGAFTDAKHLKKGQWELAEGGTVFLDEIGELSPVTQVKLLRLIEDSSFRRLGGTEDIHVDVRIITATNRDIHAAMKEGVFRQALYYRLQVINIWLPPLRERKRDIPMLSRFFIDRYNREFGKNVTGIEPSAEKAMLEYSWPGNIRELRNVIERVLILESDPLIRLKYLPPEITGKYPTRDSDSRFEYALPEEGFPLVEMEKNMIRKALKRTSGNQTRAAKLLSISRDALRYKMRKFEFLDGKVDSEFKHRKSE